MRRKIVSALLVCLCFNMFNFSIASAIHYDNIINEVLQIQKYINDKMYLEAISLCETTKNSYNLSQEDTTLLEEYRQYSKDAYQEYLNRLNNKKTTNYYISDWAMGYKFFEIHQPEYFYDDDYTDPTVIGVYYTDDDWIEIYSYAVGGWDWNYSYEIVRNPKQYVSNFARACKSYVYYDSESGRSTNVDILSENDTTVGNFPARQVTLRISEDLNRYGTLKEYSMVRCTAFQNGNWVYAIVSCRNDYTWGEDFWNKMELVRNSISFY